MVTESISDVRTWQGIWEQGTPGIEHSGHTYLCFLGWVFWPTPCGLQHPISPTRDRTSDHAIERAES